MRLLIVVLSVSVTLTLRILLTYFKLGPIRFWSTGTSESLTAFVEGLIMGVSFLSKITNIVFIEIHIYTKKTAVHYKLSQQFV